MSDRGEWSDGRQEPRGLERRMTLREYARPSVGAARSCIILEPEARDYEVGSLHYDRLPKFWGDGDEDPMEFIRNFEDEANSMPLRGILDDQLRRKIFPLTMKGLARKWFLHLLRNQFSTWEEIHGCFMARFYSMGRVAEARKAIDNFEQPEGEEFHDTFWRYKNIELGCPQHGYTMNIMAEKFYAGLTKESRNLIDWACNGMFTYQTPEYLYEIFERIARDSEERGRKEYRRRRRLLVESYESGDDRMGIDKNGLEVHNGFVIPYNRYLLLKYQAHINVEFCNQSKAIKYLFKYINKGNDRISAEIDNGDEIKRYIDCRYVSACEAAWRIFGFDIHYRTIPVERLKFHLEGQESCFFDDDGNIEDILETNPSVGQSMFLEWMKMNKNNAKARELKCWEFPQYFVWNKKLRKWTERKQNFAVGRINYVPVGCGELYYLRVMLNHKRGPTCYADLRTVGDQVYPTYKQACYALGLLDDDKEYIDGIAQASEESTAHAMRHLFTTILLSNSMSEPHRVWEETWKFLADDILRRERKKTKNPDLQLTDEQLKNFALAEIELLLQDNYSSLKNFPPMPLPDMEAISNSGNRLILDEENYDKVELLKEHKELYASLNEDQSEVFHKIMEAVDSGEGKVFFLYGSGGTGKTYIWKTLCSKIRGRGDIVLPVASSGIASLLLPHGRTTHSRFGIPLQVDETTLCNKIKPGSELAALLQKTKLIIWDEAPMTGRNCFEALDKSLRDVIKINGKRSDKPFGGKVIVFGGDFRQILPVVPKGSRQEIVNAAITSCSFWDNCEVLKLTKNMRLQTGSSDAEINETKEFAELILNIGDGTVGGENDGEVDVELPDDILIHDAVDLVAAIIESTYPSIIDNMKNQQYFRDRAILAPTNEMVETINQSVLSILPGQEETYLSSDSICKDEEGINGEEDIFSEELLNTIRCSGLPNHDLKLKVGCMVMLLRNIDHYREMCNATRLMVTKLMPHVIEAEMLSGRLAGTKVLIGRMLLSPSDNTKFPVRFERRQFPLAVCYGMTINKSQGQSLAHVGLYLPSDVFSHGQLYVAMSRVTTKNGLKVLLCDKDRNTYNVTRNVVYKEIFDSL